MGRLGGSDYKRQLISKSVERMPIVPEYTAVEVRFKSQGGRIVSDWMSLSGGLAFVQGLAVGYQIGLERALP